MLFSTWILFCGIETTFSASPGPAVLMAVSSAIKGGIHKAHEVIAGVLLGNFIYFSLSSVLILYAIEITQNYFIYIKGIGGAYLLYYAIAEIVMLLKQEGENNGQNGIVKSGFKLALIMQLANPKTLIFFIAFLPQFINHNGNVILQIAILAATSAIIEYIILVAYATGAVKLTSSARSNGHVRRLEIGGNILLIVAVLWWILVQ